MFEESVMKEICKLISDYCEKHPAAPRCGSEYVYQNDNANIDAVELVAEIMDVFQYECIKDE